MDIYLISRIFRSFDKGSYKSSNIIIYAGNYHIDYYINIIEKLGFIQKYKFTSTTNLKKVSCLKVNNFNTEYF